MDTPICLAASCPILDPWKWLTIRNAKSIPAATPAEVNIGSSKVNCTSFFMWAFGAQEDRKSNARQWVVAFRPSSNPAFPKRLEPVHTDAVNLVLEALLKIHLTRVALCTSLRAPKPPGTISKSNSGHPSKVTSGVKRKPPMAETCSKLSAIKTIRKG